MNICPNCFSAIHFHNQFCTECGYLLTTPRDDRALPLGIRLYNRYVIGRVLGVGGFGITYTALDLKTNKRRAVKEYFPAEWAYRNPNRCDIEPTSNNKVGVYNHGRDEFVNEARILRGLKNESNVVKVRDFFFANGTAYMVMELLEGYTLTGYMKANNMKQMPYQMAGSIIDSVAQTLVQIHAKMLLHRDISPNNIMITNNGEVKLIDFGSTRVYALNSLQSMSVFIKPGFAPPEQYSRSGQGPWTDVYSLAATYYYLVTGRKVPGAPDRIMGTKVSHLQALVPGIPAHVSNAIHRALKISWRDRPQTMQQFLNEFRGGASSVSSGTYSTGNVRRTGGNVSTGNSGQNPGTYNRGHSGSLGYAAGGTVYSGGGKSTQKISNSMRNSAIPYSSRGTPCVMKSVGNVRERYRFPKTNVLSIGRRMDINDIVLNDSQVSRTHCQIQYSLKYRQFLVTNYSVNETYTSKGRIKTGQKIYLVRGDWIYIQTSHDRYIFYMEEE